MQNQQTKDLIEELSEGGAGIPAGPVATVNDGFNNGTYVVKELVYAYAMWISPSFHLKVIRTFDAVVTGNLPAVQSTFPVPKTFSEALLLADLIVITDGEPRTTTLAIAEGTEVEHKAVIQLVRKYQADIEELGRVTFEMLPFETAGGTQKREVALLNEQQATLIIAFMRNTEIVVEFKKRLVKAFYALKAQVEASPAVQVPTNMKDALKLAWEAMEEKPSCCLRLRRRVPPS